jgi:hypothetical protein
MTEVPDSIRVALGIFGVLWAILASGIVLARIGPMPAVVVELFDAAFIDVFYRTGYRIWAGTLPASPLGFSIASSTVYALLASFVGMCVHIFSE